MNTKLWLVALAPWLAVSSLAQEKQLSSTGSPLADSEAALQLGEVGDHHRVWQRVTVETDRYDNKISRTNAAYTELETGMNVRQPDGSWVEASDEIEIVKNGAVARKGRHQVIFSVNCNSPVAIDMLTTDGKRLQSRILGLAYTDKATGESVLIAEIKDSDGQLLMDTKNEVIYYDAMTDVKCDVRYKNSKAGLEQDIILRENPPSPADYKLNPETTVLEVLTEFFNPPVPEKKSQFTDGTINEVLDFGDLKMGNGRVYVMGEETTEIPVTKQWGTLDGRTFLIEEIRFTSVETVLKSLPGRTASLMTSPDGILHQVSVKRLLPDVKQAKKGTGPMKLASAPLSGKGVVLDYTTASSTTNYTFKGDSTYYVSGLVNLSASGVGGATTIEAGTILKFTNSATAKINLTGPGNFKTSPYRPAVFTSKDDNTVGEIISGSTGNPTNSNGGTYISTQEHYTYQHLRMAYAGIAVRPDDNDSEFWHCQFIRCGTAISVSTGGNVSLHNTLFSVCGTAIASGDGARGEQVTADRIGTFLAYGSGFLTNSILTAVTNLGVTCYNCVTNASGNGIYQTVGAASHYLADNTFRNAGTTNINASLALNLKNLTTYPPIELTNNFTVATVLAPQAQRDTDQPDLGYHYDPLDYVVKGRTVLANLTLTNGVAVGTYGASGYGLGLHSGSFVSEGTPTRLNWIVRYNTVQEQSTTNWSASTVAAGVSRNSSAANVSTRFTGWSVLGGTGDHFIDATDATTPSAFSHSRFGGGKFTVDASSIALTNCLWERVYVTVKSDADNVPWYLFNNLFYGGTLYYRGRGDSDLTMAYDNLFDKTTITRGSGGTSDYFTHGWNGYVSTTHIQGTSSGGDKDITWPADYQDGPLAKSFGKYYYPITGTKLNTLINADSTRTPASVGLYHYTVKSAVNSKEGTDSPANVDIGFHYVAVDSSGNAIDNDGDGWPDYFEDTNGNGVADTSEKNWQVSENGTAGIPGLLVFTPLQ